MTVEVKGEDGETQEIDNPELHGEGQTKPAKKHAKAVERTRARLDARGGPTLQKDRSGVIGNTERLFANIEGVDKDICMLMIDEPNWTYAQIGEHLKITENAVKLRISRMAKRFRKQKPAHTVGAPA